jgi:RimJ/RimL family protein N-acetyltransferase
MDYILFEGELLYLDVFEPEKDAAVEARWTNDPGFVWPLEGPPAKPLSAGQVKKQHEKDKEAENANKLFHFVLRSRQDDRPLGFTRLQWIEWPHGTSHLRLYIGDTADRGKGYGTEALRLVLRYIFEELNLYRVAVSVAGYNEGAIRFFERAGFVTEVRWRKAIHRNGRRWDLLHMGLLRDEWQSRKSLSPITHHQ